LPSGRPQVHGEQARVSLVVSDQNTYRSAYGEPFGHAIAGEVVVIQTSHAPARAGMHVLLSPAHSPCGVPLHPCASVAAGVPFAGPPALGVQPFSVGTSGGTVIDCTAPALAAVQLPSQALGRSSAVLVPPSVQVPVPAITVAGRSQAPVD